MISAAVALIGGQCEDDIGGIGMTVDPAPALCPIALADGNLEAFGGVIKTLAGFLDDVARLNRIYLVLAGPSLVLLGGIQPLVSLGFRRDEVVDDRIISGAAVRDGARNDC